MMCVDQSKQSVGYTRVGDVCQPESCSLCYTRNSCYQKSNTASFFCSGYIIPGSIVTDGSIIFDTRSLLSDTLPTPTLAYLFNDTKAGHVLNLTVILATTPTIRSIWLGSSTAAMNYSCSSFWYDNTISLQSPTTPVQVECILPSAYGTNLYVSILVCNDDNVTCMIFTDVNTTISFAMSTITSQSLHEVGGSGSALVQLGNTLAQTVIFDGTNFYPIGMQVYYGPIDAPQRYICSVDIIMSSTTTIYCTTASYSIGTNTFTIVSKITHTTNNPFLLLLLS
jgi:hypothetical protein